MPVTLGTTQLGGATVMSTLVPTGSVAPGLGVWSVTLPASSGLVAGGPVMILPRSQLVAVSLAWAWAGVRWLRSGTTQTGPPTVTSTGVPSGSGLPPVGFWPITLPRSVGLGGGPPSMTLPSVQPAASRAALAAA